MTGTTDPIPKIHATLNFYQVVENFALRWLKWDV
jgi:hypothetical protein